MFISLSHNDKAHASWSATRCCLLSINQPTSPLINGSDGSLSDGSLLWECRALRRTICKVKRCLLKRRFHVCSRLLSRRKTISKGEQNLLRNCHGAQTIYRIFFKMRNVVRNLLRATPNVLLLKRHQAQTAARSNFFSTTCYDCFYWRFISSRWLFLFSKLEQPGNSTWWHTRCVCVLKQVRVESISSSVPSRRHPVLPASKILFSCNHH